MNVLNRGNIMNVMRAKMVVNSVTKYDGYETLKMDAVGKNESYPEDGSDDDNTYAKFTPAASLEMHINNPKLHGSFLPGQKYYLDFTKA